MTIRELLSKGYLLLKGNEIEEPKLKSRLLLQYTLKKTRDYLLIYDKEQISEEQTNEYMDYICDLIQGVPLQHITHRQEFMKMDFYVNENVLIPRADTEILVEEAIDIIKRLNAPRVLDLCTGSGAIAVALARYTDNAEIFASDISEKALKVAVKNAKDNGVKDKITFVKSNLFEEFSKMKFDVIVSNPPYIKRAEIQKLNKDVQEEPIIALDGGKDGLYFYKKIIRDGYEFLKYNGYLCLEIGYDQKLDVVELIENQSKYNHTYSKKDLYGNDRVIITKLGD